MNKQLRTYMVYMIIALHFIFLHLDGVKQVEEHLIMQALVAELTGGEHIIVHTLHKTQGSNIVLYSYDFADTHFYGFRFFKKESAQYYLLGGAHDMLMHEAPVTFTNSFVIHNNDLTIISFGEIQDPKIEGVEIHYSDGSHIHAPNTKNAYIGVKNYKNALVEPIKIKGLDENNRVIYEFLE